LNKESVHDHNNAYSWLPTYLRKTRTQIHTHMFYSEFNEIIDSVAALDADVITIETSRSNMELLKAFE